MQKSIEEIGGSEVGAGKTLFYAKPNILQTSNNSYIILDPKRRNFKRYRLFVRKKRI